jgi:selenocysteine-specific elongation factor
VDHGKSTLVEALTGINPMHLPEEHRRELTIELGFAHLRHPDGYTIGVVDVPGHEKLVKTMISGASGFQIALWVVDAREGLMPQSLEHLDVLNLLGVERIIPVISKAGLATAEEIQETRQSIGKLLPVPVHVVDSLTRMGIPELRDAIFDACRAIGADVARAEAPPYLPIDRCFVLKGVGAVVTGTLVRGTLREGDSVSVSSHPAPYRIRSLHQHNQSVGTISAGHRVGVHLHGLKSEDVARGDVLVKEGYPWRSRYLNVQLRFLKGAAFRWKPGLRAHFLTASFEMECRVWGLVEAAEHIWAQIELPREGCFYAGQRFILRSTNPLITIGGGTVVDIAPNRPRRVTEPERVPQKYFEISKPEVFELSTLTRKWMCAPDELPSADIKQASGLVWHNKLDVSSKTRLGEMIHRAGDSATEWSFPALARELKIRSQYVGPYLQAFLATNFKEVLTLTSSTLRFDPRRGELSDTERRVAEDLVAKLRNAGLQPMRLAEYLLSAQVDRKVFDKAVAKLLKGGRLIRIDNEFVLERSVWDAFKDQVLRVAQDSFTASEFGKHFGLSRKYSVPYLECLNRMGCLRRQGDRHVVVRR